MSGYHADVLIIGAGPSGGVAANRLAQAGLRVTVLEQGDWHGPHQYRGAEWDWELAAAKTWSTAPGVRGAAADYPIDTTDSDMQVLNFNGVGGGTVLFNAVWIRLLESNFRTRSVSGLGDDWPISYADLLPFYERTDREFGVSGLGGNPAYPPGAEPPLPPLPLGPGPMKIARALSRRGWHWWPDTNAILSAPYDGRRQCVQRGACASGCNEGAKSSADVTHWRKAEALGVRLLTGARVLRIVLDGRGLAAGAEWVDREGGTHFQSADVVLCAANAIGTPRLLLNSADTAFPDGLANRSGLVGRRLMMHPLAVVAALFKDPLESWQGHNGSAIQCLNFAEHDASRGFALGAKWSLHPAAAGPATEALRVIAEFGPGGDLHRRFAERWGHGVYWTIMCEDLPDEANRVELSRDLTDSSGMPGAKLFYRYSENSRKILDFNVERAREIMSDAGAWKVSAHNPSPANAHFMGTARMGDDARTSVVDSWGMSHDVLNLGILDASVFVTASSVNPTSTICALALRAAERLLERRASLPTPARRTSVAAPPRPAAAPAPAAPAPEPVSEAEREQLKRLAGGIIPVGDDLPSGSEVGLEGRALDRILAVRPDLSSDLKRALGETTEAPAEALATLAAADVAAYQALLIVVTMGYYMDSGVRARIGYEGQVPRPVRPDNFPEYIAEGLLDHLMDDAA